jgi:hypothetical protein
MILSEALYDLFTALSSWDFIGRRGITLELSIHSSSDPEHFFRNRTIQAVKWTGDECLEDEDESRAFLARRPVKWDERHCWKDGRQVIPAGPDNPDRKAFEDSKQKLLGRPLQIIMITARALRRVHVISAFVIRRQYHRHLAPEALGHILMALPALRSVQYEVWSRTSVERTQVTMKRATGKLLIFPL